MLQPIHRTGARAAALLASIRCAERAESLDRAHPMPTRTSDAPLQTLQIRFERHPHRHAGIAWADVAARLAASPGAITALQGLEATGGEPDVVGRDDGTGEVLFVDCCRARPPAALDAEFGLEVDYGSIARLCAAHGLEFPAGGRCARDARWITV